jgi:hypothetical protein
MESEPPEPVQPIPSDKCRVKELGVGLRKDNRSGRLGIMSRMGMLKRKSRLFFPSVKIYANMTITYGYHMKQARSGKGNPLDAESPADGAS